MTRLARFLSALCLPLLKAVGRWRFLRRFPRIRYQVVPLGAALIKRAGPREPRWTRLSDGTEMLLALSDPMQLRIYLLGSYSEAELRRLTSFISEGDVCLDVGAHVGLFTTAMGRAAGPSGRVLSIEPSPDTRRLLAENIRRAGTENQTTILAHGLSDGDGTLALYEPSDAGDVGRRSLLPVGEPVFEIEVRTFDKVAAELGLDRLDVVKIDVEGAEASVLRGMSKTLSRLKPKAVLLETVAELNVDGAAQVRELMKGFGYSPDARLAGYNTLYVPD